MNTKFRIMPKKPLKTRVLRKFGPRVAVSSNQFRDARIFSGMTREQAADFLQVSVRTIGHWETGRARPSYAAFKLLRVYRHGDLIHPDWSHCRINRRGALVTPEGREIQSSDLSWFSLLVRRAKAFGELLRQREEASAHMERQRQMDAMPPSSYRGPFPQPSIDVTYSGWGLLTGPTGCKGGASIAGVFGPGSNTGHKGPEVAP